MDAEKTACVTSRMTRRADPRGVVFAHQKSPGLIICAMWKLLSTPKRCNLPLWFVVRCAGTDLGMQKSCENKEDCSNGDKDELAQRQDVSPTGDVKFGGGGWEESPKRE